MLGLASIATPLAIYVFHVQGRQICKASHQILNCPTSIVVPPGPDIKAIAQSLLYKFEEKPNGAGE